MHRAAGSDGESNALSDVSIGHDAQKWIHAGDVVEKCPLFIYKKGVWSP